MKTSNSSPASTEPTIRDLQRRNKELEELLEAMEVVECEILAKQAEEFIHLCGKTLERGTVLNDPNRPYSDRIVSMLESYTERWSSVVVLCSQEDLPAHMPNSRRSVLSRIGKWFWRWKRRYYSDDDLPELRRARDLLPARLRKKKDAEERRSLLPFREFYTDNDLPDIAKA